MAQEREAAGGCVCMCSAHGSMAPSPVPVVASDSSGMNLRTGMLGPKRSCSTQSQSQLRAHASGAQRDAALRRDREPRREREAVTCLHGGHAAEVVVVPVCDHDLLDLFAPTGIHRLL